MSRDFPRMLYRGDEQIVVESDAAQAERLKEGFQTYESWRAGEKPVERKKPGPKPKVA